MDLQLRGVLDGEAEQIIGIGVGKCFLGERVRKSRLYGGASPLRLVGLVPWVSGWIGTRKHEFNRHAFRSGA